jgi:hypothetical protein
MSKPRQDAGPLQSLIATLSIPAGSTVPDPADGRSSMPEYDRYFRIVRDNPDLLQWTRTCLDLLGTQLRDLAASGLDWKEKSQILEGMVVIQRVTLEKWAKLGAAREEGPEV